MVTISEKLVRRIDPDIFNLKQTHDDIVPDKRAWGCEPQFMTYFLDSGPTLLPNQGGLNMV